MKALCKGLCAVLLLLSPGFVHAEEGPSEPTVVDSSVTDATPGGEGPSEADVSEGGEVSEESETGEYSVEESIADPLEPWNRLIFTFNDRLYFWLMKPLGKGYNAVVPEMVRVSVKNVFHNLTMPVRFVNSLLQVKLKSAGNELVRFIINSTGGIGGLFDFAKTGFGIESSEEDLGQTLGHYGIGNGFYIVWPFLGPSTLRDTVGTVGDAFLTPVNYVTPAVDRIAIQSSEYFNNAALRIGEYESLKESSIEPYIALRDGYVQYRKGQVRK